VAKIATIAGDALREKEELLSLRRERKALLLK
jgi:hypothetical protein